ncbi:MAG: hypothetical protein NTW27_09125 [Deltaproteobacteria bacterium]|nr:hypothetical protein [Deltaproteobacteria bacterium]
MTPPLIRKIDLDNRHGEQHKAPRDFFLGTGLQETGSSGSFAQ